jgi:hypothetical protein
VIPELCLAYAAFRVTARLSCSRGTFCGGSELEGLARRGYGPSSPGRLWRITPMMVSWLLGSGLGIVAHPSFSRQEVQIGILILRIS